LIGPVFVGTCVVTCAVPVGEPIVGIVSGGTELERQVKTGDLVRLHILAINPKPSVLEFIVHKQ
jgi:hypothetical protein